MVNKETIFAQSTPIGNGGIGIIKISGKKSKQIAIKILGKIPKTRYAEYLKFKNIKGKIIDFGIAIYYKKPNSYTGEDILELHTHGGQKIIETIIENIIKLKIKNTRIAKPGEFTERAFLNKKINLIQAESIHNMIYANSKYELYSAIKSFQGKSSKKIKFLIKKIKKVNILLEKEINFTEQDNQELHKKIKLDIKSIYKHFKLTYKIFKKNKNINNNNFKIIIVGQPNVGKSSLMNKITNKKTSIVTNIPGTTRDIIKEYFYIKNIPIQITDTAGIHKTNNKIEILGIKKIWKQIKQTQIILFLTDARNINEQNIIQEYNNIINIKKNKIIFLIRNKIDLTQEKFKIKKKKKYIIINISIKNNIGIKKILNIIKKKIKKINNTENNFIVHKRQIILMKKSLKYIQFIYNNNHISLDIILEYLLLSQQKLEELLGKNITNSNKILKNIFSKFCVGK